MKILGIIPARGGSKGIKDKNIIRVGQKPLIEYSIEPALALVEAGLLTRAILSTDSPKIAEVAKNAGLEVPFLRPESISNDTAKSIDYVIHALDFFDKQGERFDAVLILQPTSPLRSFEDLSTAIKLFTNGESDSLISVYREDYINDLVMYRFGEEKPQGVPLNPLHNKGIRRQDHGAVYVRNGCIYLTKTHYLRQTHQIISDFPLLYEMSKRKSVNIDTLEDLEIIKKMI